MKKYFLRAILFAVPTALLVFLLHSCANRGAGPQGGPKDTIPPHIVKSVPENGTLNFSKQKIEIAMNEIVLLEKMQEKVIVSPPQKTNATIKAYGKKVVVQFNDSIKPGTTYVVDFADAIVDNNEKNPLKNYAFTFSSGPLIDTLRISGHVIDAETLNPCAAVLVGAHSDLNDSAFTTKPFDIVAKTDENGYFCIKNAREGTRYHLYALKDINGNYLFDMKEELLAFQDTVYTPVYWTEERNDTIMADSLTIDTIYSYRIPMYRPNDIVLKMFKEYAPVQKFIKAERKLPHKFDLFFNAPLDTMPLIKPLNFTFFGSHILQKSRNVDTLSFWLTDSLDWRIDTLAFELYHPRTDSLGLIEIKMDTIKLPIKADIKKNTESTSKSSKRGSKKGNTEEKPRIEFLQMKTNLKSYFDVYLPIQFSFDTPIKHFDASLVHLEMKKDTIWEPIAINIEPDSVRMNFTIAHEWIPEKEYSLTVDSAAFYEYYGKHTNKFNMKFRTRSLEDYANLFVVLTHFTGKEHILLLNKKEEVVREKKAEKETAFEYLEPGEYYMKLYIDENENGKWDVGEYESLQQAESVYFFPAKIVLRAFWDVEEEWDYTYRPLLKQKPVELIKSNTKK